MISLCEELEGLAGNEALQRLREKTLTALRSNSVEYMKNKLHQAVLFGFRAILVCLLRPCRYERVFLVQEM